MGKDRIIMVKMASQGFLSCFYWNLFIHAGNDDIHKGLNEFKILPVLMNELRSQLLLSIRKNTYRLLMGKQCLLVFFAAFDQIHFLHSCNKVIHRSLDVFKY